MLRRFTAVVKVPSYSGGRLPLNVVDGPLRSSPVVVGGCPPRGRRAAALSRRGPAGAATEARRPSARSAAGAGRRLRRFARLLLLRRYERGNCDRDCRDRGGAEEPDHDDLLSAVTRRN